MSDENIKKANFLLIKKTAQALKSNGFNVEICDSREEAATKIVSLIGEDKKVGFGGSMTLNQIGFIPEIKTKNKVYFHTPEMNMEERRKVWLACMDCDFYLASPQAITSDGKLIFIDGTGNRCAALTWGPRHIILPTGRNKIVKDTEEGLWRMRNVSAIANNIRLNKKNPCVSTGKCEDCSSPERICNIVTQIWKKPKVTNYTVILVNENLGY